MELVFAVAEDSFKLLTFHNKETDRFYRVKACHPSDADSCRKLRQEHSLHHWAYRIYRRSIICPWQPKPHMLLYEVSSEFPTVDAHYLDSRKPQQITLYAILSHMANISKAIHALHSHSIFHGRLDFSSLYIDLSDRILLGDFSMALFLSRITDTVSIMHHAGRPPPELVFNQTSNFDLFKLDMWNFGITFLYLWLTDIEPIRYDKPNFIETRLRRCNTPPVLVDILASACHYEYKERATMLELHQKISTALLNIDLEVERALEIINSAARDCEPRNKNMQLVDRGRNAEQRDAELKAAVMKLIETGVEVTVDIHYSLCIVCGNITERKTSIWLKACGHLICQRCAVNRVVNVRQEAGQQLSFEVLCDCRCYSSVEQLLSSSYCLEALWGEAVKMMCLTCPRCNLMYENQVGFADAHFMCLCGTRICTSCFKIWKPNHRCFC